jgi:predicted HicB family RNase H-like nuclease
VIIQIRAKQERIVEAVRNGFEGLAAVEFIQQSGYAMTPAGIAKHLRAMGGRGHIQQRIADGYSNVEILQECFPQDDLSQLRQDPPEQPDLFAPKTSTPFQRSPVARPENIYEMRKMAIKVPADLYEAIRLASKAENKSQNELIVDVLTSALARVPIAAMDHEDDSR